MASIERNLPSEWHCANCGRKGGRLEEPRVVDDYIVCPTCQTSLLAQRTAETRARKLLDRLPKRWRIPAAGVVAVLAGTGYVLLFAPASVAPPVAIAPPAQAPKVPDGPGRTLALEPKVRSAPQETPSRDQVEQMIARAVLATGASCEAIQHTVLDYEGLMRVNVPADRQAAYHLLEVLAATGDLDALQPYCTLRALGRDHQRALTSVKSSSDQALLEALQSSNDPDRPPWISPSHSHTR